VTPQERETVRDHPSARSSTRTSRNGPISSTVFMQAALYETEIRLLQARAEARILASMETSSCEQLQP